MKKLILIKYGELTTKKGNRKYFINLLKDNIEKVIGVDGIIINDRVRMYIEVEDEKLKTVCEKLQKVFGVHSIVVSYKVNTNIDEIKECILKVLTSEKIGSYQTFKVITKRADKSFEINSMDFNRLIAPEILKNTDLTVDVHNPDLKINIEIRNEGTFIYFDEIKGLGGYPVGVQGKGILMLSGGIDSPVAGYLSLKRGVSIECLYFDSPPHTSIEAKNKVITLAKKLNEYTGNIKLIIVPFTKLQEEIYKNVDDSYIITIIRRMMYRIAEKVMEIRGAKVIINGESIGQVASQTLNSMVVINNVTNVPIIRPVACLDKLEIIDIAKKINTYDTSILPYEDCCTIFLPKHPVINPKLEKCIFLEQNLSYEKLIDEIIGKIEIIDDFNINKNDLL